MAARLTETLHRLWPDAVAGDTTYRASNRLTRVQRLATCYDQRAAAYLAMITSACILDWI